MIKVAIVDDHAVVRMGMKYAIALFKDMKFVGEHSDGEGALEFYRKTKPDVLLMDIRMPGKTGVEALEEIITEFPAARVIMLTTSGTDEDVFRSLNLGAKGYVMKDRDPNAIMDAIRAVAEGKNYVPPAVKQIYENRERAQELSPRELETLELLAEGLSNKEIAAKLGISEDGVKNHLRHIFEKLDARDRTEAVIVALKRGIVVK